MTPDRMARVRLLVNFGYYRKQWIAPFESLSGTFEVIYLFYIHPSQELEVHTQKRIIYWSDFTGAYHLLDEVSPDRVVFMDVTSGLAIALNMASKRRELPTFLLQHGLYHSYEDYRKREIASRKTRSDQTAEVQKAPFEFSSLSFFRNSVRLADLWSLPAFMFYLYLLRKEGHNYACKRVNFEARKPKYYICYTPDNARIHRQLDGKIEDRCRYIGNPELYKLNKEIQVLTGDVQESDYFLLIDQPFADNRFGEHIKSREEMTRFYTGLARWCKSKGGHLKVKLHPESFHSEWLPQEEGIDWVKATDDMASLIACSRGCFGFFSTLVLPVICHKPTALFRVGESPLYEDITSLRAAQVLEFGDFERINLKRKENSDIQGFINRYFYQIDKDPVDLLAEVLDK